MAEDLVKFIKEEDIKNEYGDKIYLLLDTDINQNKTEQIEKAKDICNKNGIELITSTPTFEIWYILHFEYTTRIYQNSKQVKEDMATKIEDYTENKNIFPIIKNRTSMAIKNAKKLENYQQENKRVFWNENCNPYTGVYKVVEELIKRKES